MNSVDDIWSDAYEDQQAAMRSGWLNILGRSAIFPRDVLIQIPGLGPNGEKDRKYQVLAKRYYEYHQTIMENASRRDMWVGWSQSNMYDVRSMDWVYGDVDSSDLETSLERARSYEEHCMDTFGVQPATIFSCGKGFHCHFTHDPVPYRGRAYSEAVERVMRPSDVELDVAPLKHRKAKPRIPYTLNIKATGRERRPMFVIPVDLSWDLEEMMDRAADCDAMSFRVPHSSTAAKAIAEHASRIEEDLDRMRRQPRDTDRESKLVKAALTFSRMNGPTMSDRFGRPDGRKRIIYSLLVPALMHEHGGDENMVLAEVEDFVADCGGRWDDYHAYTIQCISTSIMDDNRVRLPMGLKRFLAENPGLKWGLG